MANLPLYPHPLPARTIRLLSIEPGDPGSPLQCKLQEICLDSTSVPYYALSYVWGTDHSLVFITCNSHSHPITPNLHSVLLEYRHRNTQMPLWVDALCINQADTSERTSQVRVMQDIYSRAKCVIVWLGEAEESDAPALQLLKTINAPFATITDHMGRKIPLFTGQDVPSHDAELGAKVPDAYFDALASFLLRPWFSRIWIVQELLSAQSITTWCGAATLDEFPVLEAAARMMQMSNCNTRTQMATMELADSSAQGIGRLKLACAGGLEALKLVREDGLCGILYLLLVTRGFDATDPKDKIFALVGLASDVDEGFVNYTKSYQEVIRQLGRMLLDSSIEAKTGCALDIWSCITRNADEEVDMPSWVVDWLELKDKLYTPLMGQYPSEELVMQRRPEVRFSEDEHGREVLYVRATIFDTVTHIISSPIGMRQLVPQSDLISSQYRDASEDWHARVVELIAPPIGTDQNAIYHPTGEPSYDAFWRTLCCNRSSVDLTARPADDSSYLAWRRLLEMQKLRFSVEASYRRVNKLQKRLFWGIATVSISALTYRFRRHKLLAIATALTLPSSIKWFNKTWDVGLNILLNALHKVYMQQTYQTQIEARDFEGSHSKWTQGRQFCVTREGLMGWVPLAARVGDQVGVFAGCRIPYVLRTSKEGHRIVGDTYLHGIMDGEGEGSEGEMIRIV